MSKRVSEVLPTQRITINGFDLKLRPEAFPNARIPNSVLTEARLFLSSFVVRQATRTAEAVGFGWRGTADAPDNHGTLVAAYERSAATGDPLAVSNQHCEHILFTSAAANVAMRFWHDVNHVQRLRTFEPVHEVDLALWHLAVLEGEGADQHSLVWRLLHADLIGQTYCSTLLGTFPDNQLEFDLNCLAFGVDDALVLEAEKITELPRPPLTPLSLPIRSHRSLALQR